MDRRGPASVAKPRKVAPGLFWREYLKNPMAVGAITSSSPALAREMLKELAPGDNPVVELGPGTGVFTRAMLAKGLRQEQLILVEAGTEFARHLAEEMPQATVVCGDACNLVEILAHQGRGPVKHIVSSLPFRSFNKALRAELVRALGKALQPGGVMVQFTYALMPPLDPKAAAAAGLHGERCGFVAANLPPAFVWRYTKQA